MLAICLVFKISYHEANRCCLETIYSSMFEHEYSRDAQKPLTHVAPDSHCMNNSGCDVCLKHHTYEQRGGKQLLQAYPDDDNL